MTVRLCDRCGGRSSPHIPRVRVGHQLLCAGCALNGGFIQSTAAAGDYEMHPDIAETHRVHGSHHVTGGRILHTHTIAIPFADQEKRLSVAHGWSHKSSFEPVRFAIEGARSYAGKVGLGDPHEHGYDHVRQNPDTVRKIGRTYDSLPQHDPAAVPHFDAMAKEVGHQYHHLTQTMGVNVQSVDHDPYPDVHHMIKDVRDNHRLQVMGTSVTGSHPHFSDDDNDKFRAVHDFFGHAATGQDFSRHGEEAAFQAHSRMFTDHAKPAMASETRGQNASLILNGKFGPQKVATLPRHMWDSAHRLGAGWTGEDVVRFEQGKQKVHTVVDRSTGHSQVLCPMHTRQHQQMVNGYNDFASRVGEPFPDTQHSVQVHPQHEGQCQECKRRQGDGMSRPWEHTPGESFRPSPMDSQRPTPPSGGRFMNHPGRWPYRELREHESHEPFVPQIRSLNNHRVGIVRNGRVVIVLTEGNEAAIRYGMRFHAHDSGDGETIFHCPMCGSGQVIARSDGTVECEFCQTCFTVQIQPQMPSFPQTIDGQPVDVPGMPAGGVNANVPPGGAVGDPTADDDGGNPFGDDDSTTENDDDEADDDGGGDSKKPPWLKGSSLLYRTASGAALDEGQFMRHLALATANDRNAVLEQVRQENGVSDG